MNDDFEAIKDLVDIRDEITRRTGHKIKKVGNTYDLEQCPFCSGHDCFRIRPDTKSWSCHQCGKGGTIIDFVMIKKSCTVYEALTDLAEIHDYKLAKAVSYDSPMDQNNPSGLIFQAVSKYYATILHNNARALAYQKNTRKHGDQSLKDFQVGFTDGNLFAHLQRQDFNLEDILKTGLIVKAKNDGYRDFFIKGLYVYPHSDIKGNICHFSIKDPRKKYNYQLSNQYRIDGAPFYNMKPFRKVNIIIVEGENDLLSVYGQGNDSRVIAITGQISADQIQYLKKWVATGAKKTIYLCFDNDQAGEKYKERIIQELEPYCLSDMQCRINTKLRIRQENKAQDDESESAGNEIPKLRPVTIKTIKYDQKINDIDDYLKAMSAPEKEFKKLIDQAVCHLKPLKQIIGSVKAWHKSAGIKSCSNEIGEVFFDYFNTLGGFFVNGEACRLFYENHIYEIGNNIAFKSLIYKTAGLNYADTSTKITLEVVKARAYEKGKHTNSPGWIYTDLKNEIIYYALNNESNTIAKIQAGSVELLQNGANDDQILLEVTPRMEPVNFLADVRIQDGIDKFKIILDNFACSESNKFYIASRIVFTILLELVTARGITKFSGNQGTAKSCGARLISYLMIGSDCVSQGSVASYRSEAIKNPFIFPDNLEKADRTQDVLSFLLMSATGGMNQKRDNNTSSGNIYEENKSQVITTSIEPFTESELISRTIDIPFDKEFRNKKFPGETELKTFIEEHRDLILSCFFKIVAFEILPTFKEGKAKIYQTLNNECAGHSKERLNELFACLYLVLTSIVKYIPHSEYKKESAAILILHDWLNEQDELARENEMEANPILYRLDILFDEYSRLNKENFENIYGIHHSVKETRGIDDKIQKLEFYFSSKELCTIFSILSKNKNIQNPFQSPTILGKRLSNSKTILEDAGWQVEIRHKKINGNHKHLLAKKNN